jgi:hypothetical protein
MRFAHLKPVGSADATNISVLTRCIEPHILDHNKLQALKYSCKISTCQRLQMISSPAHPIQTHILGT